MEFIYNGRKESEDINEFLADFLEENLSNLTDDEQDKFIEICEKGEFHKSYYTNGLLDFDKIVIDKEQLPDLIFEMTVS
jgi:hypothetical protein